MRNCRSLCWLIIALIGCLSVLAYQSYHGVAQTTRANRLLEKNVSPPKVIDNWRRSEVPHGKQGDVIAFSSDGWTAIAGLGTVLLSPGGQTWKELSGGKGSFHSTIDGGTTYRNVDQLGKPLPSSFNINELCSAESAVLTSSGYLYVKTVCEHTTQLWGIPTRNQSAAWHVISFTYETDPSNGVYTAGHHLTLVGERPLIDTMLPTGSALLTTDDNGATWYQWWHGSHEDAGIVGLSFIDERTGWMLEGNGRLLKTLDGGRQWDSITLLPSEFTGKFNALAFVDSRVGFIVGDRGLLLATLDGGRTWGRNSSPTTVDLYQLAAADTKHVWVVGNKGTVLESRDGGDHWRNVELGIEKDIRFGLNVKDGIVWLVLDGLLFRSS